MKDFRFAIGGLFLVITLLISSYSWTWDYQPVPQQAPKPFGPAPKAFDPESSTFDARPTIITVQKQSDAPQLAQNQVPQKEQELVAKDLVKSPLLHHVEAPVGGWYDHQAKIMANNKHRGVKSSTIVVGFCCEMERKECELQKFVHSLASVTFAGRDVYYQMTKLNGFAVDAVNTQITLSERHGFPDKEWKGGHQMFFEPDIYICQGYFLDIAIVNKKKESQRINLLTGDYENEKQSLLDDFGIMVAKRHEKAAHVYEHTKDRSFLLTMNNEFWDPHSCERYDVMFDSEYARHSRGCVVIHSPPAYWFDMMRMTANATHLVLPRGVPPKEGETRVSNPSPLQQQYLHALMEQKAKHTDRGGKELSTMEMADELRFCLFLVAVCAPSQVRPYFADVMLRVAFFDILTQLGKERAQKKGNQAIARTPEGLGGCRHNSKAKKEMGKDFVDRGGDGVHGYQGVRDGAVQIANRYKFMITMENSWSRGYLTEKLLNGVYGGTIPVYLGAALAGEFFNDKRFVNCQISVDQADEVRRIDKNKGEAVILSQVLKIAKETLTACANRVLDIDEDDVLYQSMLLQPLLFDNELEGSIMDPNTMAERLQKALRMTKSHLLSQ